MYTHGVNTVCMVNQLVMIITAAIDPNTYTDICTHAYEWWTQVEIEREGASNNKEIRYDRVQ